MHELPASRLREVFRVIFLQRAEPSRLDASWPAILAAAAFTLLPSTLYGVAMHASDGRLGLEMLPAALTAFTLSVLLALVLAATTRRAELLPAFLFTALVAWAILDSATLLVWEALRAAHATRIHFAVEYALWVLPVLWLTIAMTRLAWRSHAAPWREKIPTALAALVVIAAPYVVINPDRSLWVKDWSKQREDAGRANLTAAAHEDAIYAQPGLLSAALEAIQPGRPGTVDLFFVGLAGYGRQDVFMREVAAVTRLMEERFDAAGRSIALVNNPRTVLEAPIASVTSLRAALDRIGKRMNADEDVLVLFLTSHGSEEHHFSLDLPPLRFNRLDPAALKRILDESGIRNRVVIVSACYSGGFALPLAGPHTLVITASAADRNSFGCSNEAEWTYFGRAFFDEALRSTHSFTRAFEKAVPVIASREAAEQYTPSQPQMRGGEALAPTLRQLEARLQPATATVSREASAKLR